MAAGNHSSVTGVVLAGLTGASRAPAAHTILSGICVVQWWGTWGVITLIGLSSHLHTPMLFPLWKNCPSLTSVSPLSLPPKCWWALWQRRILSPTSMYDSAFFFLVFVISECHMLAVMAYDLYVILCSPLLYNTSPCLSSVLCGSWGLYHGGLAEVLQLTGCMLKLLSKISSVINHYPHSDFSPSTGTLLLSTYINEVVVFVFQCI